MIIKNIQVVTEIVVNTKTRNLTYKIGDEMEIETNEGYIRGTIRRIGNFDFEIETEEEYIELRYDDIEKVYE